MLRRSSLYYFLIFMILIISYGHTEIPENSRFKLSNGLTVITVEDKRQPFFEVGLYFRTTPAMQELDKAGVLTLLIDMLASGSITFPEQKLNETIDSIGGSLEPVMRRDRIGLSGHFLARDYDLVLQLVSDMMIHPEFNTDKLERLKRQANSIIIRNHNIADHRLHDLVYQAHFGSEGFGLPVMGLPEAIENLTLEDISQKQEQVIRPNNAVLMLVGDIDHNQVRKATKNYFGGWSTGKISRRLSKDQIQNDSLKIIVIDDPDSPVSEFILSCPVFTLGNDSCASLFLLNYALGGSGINSRLYKSLITEHALATTIDSRIEWQPGFGMWIINGSASQNVISDAIARVLEVTEDMQKIRISSSELADARGYYHGVFPAIYETVSSTISIFSKLTLFNLPFDYHQSLLTEMDKSTPDQLRRLARHYLATKNMVIVVNGPARILKRKLSQLGSVEVIESERK